MERVTPDLMLGAIRAAQQEPAPPPGKVWSQEDAIDWLVLHVYLRLTPWERDFIHGIENRVLSGRELSDKQYALLQKLFQSYYHAD